MFLAMIYLTIRALFLSEAEVEFRSRFIHCFSGNDFERPIAAASVTET
jgi:hypothetical protein